ncbi:unnamed protein product [Miscanthus lutarioriparius]|uniref:SET domain-containing protein n=1 Tax=Miscanthus lutarioriparius TaxID=422564 RepID=A0A811MJT9_9POAL|nr:unnamed protein product [Miscanthus lutarioriparius]
MERLKSAVPTELRRAVGEGTAADLPATTSRLFAFFDSLPLFHQVMQELTDPELALCRKDKVKAVELKGHGNACFSRREFGEALGYYSQALRHVPINSDGMDVKLVSAIYVNRASTMHKLGLFKESIRDCDRAITISPNYSKAWYRKGMVKTALKNYSSAVHDLEVALSLEVTSSGKNNIEQELKLILQKHESVNEAGTSNCDSKDEDLPLAGQPQPHKVVIESISTPNKGRGMASTDDIPPASLIHVEDPLAAIIMKSSREIHCHFCSSETPADVVFCPSCTIPIYCSKRCQEQSVGDISCDEDTHLGYSTSIANLSITSTSCKSPRSKLFAEHKHECGGAHWAAVLPTDVVLAGRIMARIIEKMMLSGKSFAISGPNLDLVHHYDQHSPANKLESHIYAIVLLFCLQNHYRSDLLWTEDSLSQLVLLTFQIKVNSISVVRVRSVDGSPELTENRGVSGAEGANMCSVEQVRVAQAVYVSGSLFNHSCQPNVHAYFLSRALVLRTTEFIKSGSPVELSYGPQDVSKIDKDMENVAKSLLGNIGVSLNIDHGCCMSCRSHIDVSSALATSQREESTIDRLKKLTLLDKTLITEALQSLNLLKKLRHPYSKALAQAEDTIAEAFAKVGDQERARKHCEASIQVTCFSLSSIATQDIYLSSRGCITPKHIIIAHELIKLVSILLSLGDGASAAATFAQAEEIFSLYYGSHVEKTLTYMGALKKAVSDA